jgi:hypothetical protein
VIFAGLLESLFVALLGLLAGALVGLGLHFVLHLVGVAPRFNSATDPYIVAGSFFGAGAAFALSVKSVIDDAHRVRDERKERERSWKEFDGR